jgi:hypothetical protein
MKRGFLAGSTVALLVFLLFLSQAAFAAIYMKEERHVEAAGNIVPAQDETVEKWITDDRMVVSSDQQKTIIDLAKGTVTHVDHERQAVLTMPLDFSEMAAGLDEEMSQEERAGFEAFMGKMMQMDVQVEETSDTKRIGNWDCRKYNQVIEMGMGTNRSEIWATTDIEVDQDLYAKFTSAMLAQIPGASQNMHKFIDASKKIKGVHVLTVATNEMMGQTITSTTRLIDFKKGRAPDNAFAIPADYREETMR